VSKRRGSPYRSGRVEQRKIKNPAAPAVKPRRKGTGATSDGVTRVDNLQIVVMRTHELLEQAIVCDHADAKIIQKANTKGPGCSKPGPVAMGGNAAPHHNGNSTTEAFSLFTAYLRGIDVNTAAQLARIRRASGL
jgi:hypothetical protein